MTYTLKLDLDEFQRSALITLLRTEIMRAEREGLSDTPFPTAIRQVMEQVDEYAAATVEAKRAALAECGTRYGTGLGHGSIGEAVCRRRPGHPPVSVDGRGHSTLPDAEPSQICGEVFIRGGGRNYAARPCLRRLGHPTYEQDGIGHSDSNRGN